MGIYIYSLVAVFMLSGFPMETTIATHMSELSCFVAMTQKGPEQMKRRGISKYKLMCVVRNKA